MKTARMVSIVVLGLGSVCVCLAGEGVWTTKTPMPTARYIITSSIVDGKVYVIGGIRDLVTGFSAVEQYDPMTDTWARKANMPMIRPSGGSGAVNGMIYYFGGRETRDGANLSSVLEYNPTTNSWTTKANPMGTPRTWLSSSVVNGKIYAIGGTLTLQGAPLSTVEEYDPATDTWTRKADMPTARVWFCTSTSAVNGKIYAIGGSPGGSQWYQGLSTVEEYDPETDMWTSKASMPTPRTRHCTCVVNGKIYAIGGMNSDYNNPYSRVEEYDPATNTWTRKTDMPTARYGLAMSAVDGKIYAIGGWSNRVLSTVEEYDLTRPPPDYNGNGVVDFADMCILLAYWHTDDLLCDIGPWPFGDGVVDIRDLAVFTDYWLADVGLIAHWKLDETEGDLAEDCAGEYEGAVNGEAVWQAAIGAVDGALELDGVNDYIETPSVLNPGDVPFSVFAWVKTDAAGNAIISQTGKYGVNWLGIDGAGRLVTELQGSGRGAAALAPGTVITDNQWHRVGFTWDGTYRRLYVDDVEVATDTSPQDMTGADGGLHIGVDKDLSDDSFFSGLIDDIRIYDRGVEP